MHCDNARQLMAEALDGADEAAFEPHLAHCPACAAEWQHLLVLETLFQTQALDTPPPDFAHRVSEYIATEIERVPAWQRSLMQIGVIVAGVFAIASGLAAFVHGFNVWVYGPALMIWLGVVARSCQSALVALVGGWSDGALAWPIYVSLALAIALAWFGVLVLPRAATSARRIRGT